MLNSVLYYFDNALLLVMGIVLTAALARVQLNRKNLLILGLLCLICGAMQCTVLALASADAVRKLYPLITHLPLLLLLLCVYRVHLLTALVSIFTVYLCCQPIKWVGLLVATISQIPALESLGRIIMIITGTALFLRHFVAGLSEIFSKDRRSVWIFGCVPIVYYFFDYLTVVYTNLWMTHTRLVGEFFPALLCIVYVMFCLLYYHAHERKADAERKEQIISIIAQQRARELEALRTNEKEIRILRHDMRLILNNISVCLENGDIPKAQEIIGNYTSYVEGAKLVQFCGNETVNYTLSYFASRCSQQQIPFAHEVNLKDLKGVDEILFSSILSNALDNALNAQQDISPHHRFIRFVMKNKEDKLLISISNPVAKPPIFVDGFPITTKEGHGYGTHSIRYLTEKLGGNCHFSMQDDLFVLRIVI